MFAKPKKKEKNCRRDTQFSHHKQRLPWVGRLRTMYETAHSVPTVQCTKNQVLSIPMKSDFD